MHGVVLVKFGIGIDFAHCDDDRGGTSEERVPGSLVGLPGIDEMGDALLEDFAVDLDFSHDGQLCKSRDWR